MIENSYQILTLNLGHTLDQNTFYKLGKCLKEGDKLIQVLGKF